MDHIEILNNINSNMSSDNIQCILNKKLVYFFIIVLIIVFFFGILSSALELFSVFEFGHDFRYFFEAVNNFWRGNDTYIQDENGGFFYLNYFCILCFWMLFPFYISLIIHLSLTSIMFYLILRNIKTKYHEWWLYGNLIMVYWWAMLFNTNIWITFAYIMFLKYREKWYSPIFLFLAFYKITTIIAFIILYCMIILFEKKIKKKQFITLLGVIGISFISLLTSYGISGNVLTFEDSLLFIQIPHYFWWSILIFEYTRYQKFSVKTLKIFWVSFVIFEFLFGLIFLQIIVEL
ncbi:MAG: hypothetical protein KGD63_00910 [Candidatus Lokiarchaeota archaeon]|nr:hypothetical protein [Candidatus Lokiarchaeota archaeon]